MGVVGISLGIVVWAGVALMGLHLILQKMAWLHQIIMVGGGIYLCWMGWQLLRSARAQQRSRRRRPRWRCRRPGAALFAAS